MHGLALYTGAEFATGPFDIRTRVNDQSATCGPHKKWCRFVKIVVHIEIRPQMV